jgi:glycosyltransferase involved in cell wall biosynthesis
VTFESGCDDDATDAIDLTVVLPCLNEKHAVGLCVAQAIEAMRSGCIRGEVVVVDNGSTDGSADIAAAAHARVIREPRRGYGRALRTGFEHARGTVVVMADADGWRHLKLRRTVTEIGEEAAALVRRRCDDFIEDHGLTEVVSLSRYAVARRA